MKQLSRECLEQEPVYQVQYGQQWKDVCREKYDDHVNHGSTVRIVYAAPPWPVVPAGWIPCSEQMPEDEQEVLVQTHSGWRYVSFYDAHSRLFFDSPEGDIEHILVTHW